jgi:hypothetical protein
MAAIRPTQIALDSSARLILRQKEALPRIFFRLSRHRSLDECHALLFARIEECSRYLSRENRDNSGE